MRRLFLLLAKLHYLLFGELIFLVNLPVVPLELFKLSFELSELSLQKEVFTTHFGVNLYHLTALSLFIHQFWTDSVPFHLNLLDKVLVDPHVWSCVLIDLTRDDVIDVYFFLEQFVVRFESVVFLEQLVYLSYLSFQGLWSFNFVFLIFILEFVILESFLLFFLLQLFIIIFHIFQFFLIILHFQL